jgi:uncharacterized repeat protein (TIGR03803 family)
MKALKSLSHFTFILAVLGSTLTGRMAAQTFTVLHTFTNSPDGYAINGGLLLSGNVIYGMTGLGGAFGYGTVFRINSNGTGLTNLHSFSAFTNYINSDGAWPVSVLALSGNALYGTTYYGGTGGNGTVFRINTDGTGFTNLHYFTATVSNTNSDGAEPRAGLIISGNTLFGVATSGGSTGKGTIFAVNTNGTGFTNLYNFGTTPSDGSEPYCSLVTSSNVLYGIATEGGSQSSGIIFSINTNGTGYKILYNFDTIRFPTSLILSDNTLYGTAEAGRFSGQYGSVYSFNLTNSVFTSLHDFIGPDGVKPESLILAGNTLYGTTGSGYNTNRGIVFSINTDGTGLKTLYAFSTTSGTKSTNSDGSFAFPQLVNSGNTLYGMATGGGLYGFGTLFSLLLPIVPPQLTISSVETNVLLAWPTNATGFTLQFTTNLASPTVWNTNSTPPVFINQQNVVTNTISGAQMFYRLSQPLP